MILVYVLANPLISVIIPLYNEPELVQRAILSVQEQSLKDVEIIVVDDCSTNVTAPSMVEAMRKQDPRISLYLLKENSGPFFARIVGIHKSTGSYLMFLDADDYYNDQNILQTAYNTAIAQKADLVHFREQVRDVTGFNPFVWANPVVNSSQNALYGVKQWALNGQGTALHGKLIQRDVILKGMSKIQEFMGDFFKFKLYYSEDILMMLGIYLYAEKYEPIEDIGYTYNIYESSLSITSQVEFEKVVKRAESTIYALQIVKQMLADTGKDLQRHIRFQIAKLSKNTISKAKVINEDQKAEICKMFLESGLLNAKYIKETINEECMFLFDEYRSVMNQPSYD
ncbi:Glycosyl_transferase family 2 protein [Hexamita inflata]|uniref:Glycosyl transferase family 2 protein n=1 Tax=Hexamita inflata TaxID=28002 RepID=A0AA86PMB6_9EUKA|nr:Glycosyl transferase family 2 protein [Hexamita inflata]